MYIDVNGKRIKVHRVRRNKRVCYEVYGNENNSETEGLSEAFALISYGVRIPINIKHISQKALDMYLDWNKITKAFDEEDKHGKE